jgi:hypothetical protein
MTPSKVAGKVLSVRILGSRKILYAIQHPGEVFKDIESVRDLEIGGKHVEFIGFAPIEVIDNCTEISELTIRLYSPSPSHGSGAGL